MRCALNICALILLLCGVASAFTVSGNKLLDANGNPTLLRGIARPSFEWDKNGEHASLADYTLMKNWGSNVVRVGLSQCFWLESSTADAYKATVDQQVQWIKSLGMAVIIDLHWSNKNAASGGCGQQVMADGNSITFWTQVANKYKSDTSILFELYNEPHDVPWSVWLNGGDAGAGFTVVGMQQLYNTVRGTGANNVVIVSGLNYAYDLSGIPQYALSGNNIMYNTHPYDFGGKQPADWPTGFGFLAENYALIATEFGEFSCNPTFNQQFVNYANQHSISWTAWGWYVGGCGFPSLITDWAGTPAATAAPVKCDLMYTQKIPGNTTQVGGSCSGSGSTTGGSGIGTGVNITLYADAVEVFTDYTWAAKTPADPTFKHSGSYSYSWTPSNYNAMYFYSAGALSTTKYRGLEFWVHGGTTGNQNIKFNVVQGSPTATKIGPDLSVASYIGANSIPTSWRRGFVDFSAFPAGNYDGVWFQSSSTGTDGVVYFDDIVLVAYPPATTTAGASAATTTAGGSATTTTSSKAASTSSTAGVSTSTSTTTTTTTTTTTSTTSTSTTSTATTATNSPPASSSSTAASAATSTSSRPATTTTASNSGASTSAANTATTSTSSRPATSSTSTNAGSATTSTSSNAAATTSANAASSTSAGPAATTGTPAASSTSSRPGTTSATSAQSTSATSASSGSTQNAATTTAKGASTASSTTSPAPAATTTSKGASTASGASTTQSASSTATSAVATPGPTVTTTGSSESCATSGAVGCTCSTDANCNPNLFCVFGKCQADSAIVDSHSSTLKHSILFVIAGVGALLLM